MINALFNQLDEAVKDKFESKYTCMTGCDITVAIHEERKLISKIVLGLTPIQLFDKPERLTSDVVAKITALIEYDIELLKGSLTYSERRQKLEQLGL